MTRVQLQSQEVSSSKSHFTTVDECLLLAGFAFYAEMYLGTYSVFQKKQQSLKSRAVTLLTFL